MVLLLLIDVYYLVFLFFFFQAEDGIRDWSVTGVQTCALPIYQQPCVTIHFTWKQDWPAVRKLLPVIENELAPFKARPHWGKLFTISPAELKSIYKKMPEFIELCKTYDPNGKFRNEFLNVNIFG